MTDQDLLELDDVHAGYGDSMILHGISTTIAEGSITTIIGPNGAGKSTLLRTIFGILELSSGAIRLAGTDISGYSHQKRLQEGIAFLLQGNSVFAPLTVRDNLELGGHLLESKTLDERIGELMEQFPILAEKSGVEAKHLSGGERRLLEISRALVLEPTLFLMDEPSLGLDPQTREMIFEHIEMLNEAGVTVLMVEQNAVEAIEISDEAVVLVSGEVELEGGPQEVLDNPEIRRLYLGN
jgi:branched-chain amino acid transport system ATP-binding protein